MSTLLIVEDEKDLAQVLEYNLKREGFQVHLCFSAEEAVSWINQHPLPDLAILDIVLPGMSGVELCRRWRQSEASKSLPILFLSARAEETDRIIGFEMGADDYMAKPFHVRELLLRIRAILRRQTFLVQPAVAENNRLHNGRLLLDRKKHQVFVDNQEVALTSMEFKLLEILLTHKGEVQSRDDLLAAVWNIHNNAIQTRTVDVHIKRLRQKLGASGDLIETVRNIGYCLRDSTQE
ncbi:response regulator transcription factor [Candidatus Magnetaquicoccus inordinatus]|uniref:response regulator transcription factor n=1 Tax=Candidatus Magnetaquicoccus inordinatus TaxID=2496818 RepID=UPI00102BD2A9|nr:response regulator transcription factor [Candidatus Magnetaquicoccus inordinatus]